MDNIYNEEMEASLKSNFISHLIEKGGKPEHDTLQTYVLANMLNMVTQESAFLILKHLATIGSIENATILHKIRTAFPLGMHTRMSYDPIPRQSPTYLISYIHQGLVCAEMGPII